MRQPKLISAPGSLAHWVDLPAPAKLNLFLHITGRRPDGMHNLQSVFVLVDWADYIGIAVQADAAITRVDKKANEANETKQATTLPAEDLTVKAAKLLQTATGSTQGATITLEKHLPSQAGMGGGSSNAATCLLALNRLWDCHLSEDDLCRLALQLGADVPFFIRGHNAWVEGVGDIITPIPAPIQSYWILKPPAGVSTPAIFGSPSLCRDTPATSLTDYLAQPAENRMGFGRNDLEPVASALCPDVHAALARMHQHGLTPRMSGSGSAVFAVLAKDIELEPGDLPDNWLSRKCKNIAKHPMHDWEWQKIVR